MTSVTLVSLILLLVIVKEIFRSKRKLRFCAGSPRAKKHQKKVAMLTTLAVALAVSSELIIAAIIASSS